MKKILFVISYLDKGGAERALSNITNNMPKDWEIDILVNSNKVIDYEYRGNIISLGIDETPKMTSVLFHIRLFFKRLRQLKKMKKQNGYVACVSFLDSANVVNILSKTKGCKTIVSIRCSLTGRARSPQYRFIANPLVRLTHNRADCVVAVSQGIANELIDKYGIRSEKVRTIENGYDLCEMHQLAEKRIDNEIEQFIQGKKIFVTSGRLDEQKGQWHLIRAFSELAKTRTDIGLIVLGTGSLQNYLQELVTDYCLEDKVFFAGFCTNPYQILYHSDVFVLPSMFEGFPNSLAEAICLGMPCIATDFQTGARELLDPSVVGDGRDIQYVKEGEYGILSPLCSGNMYSSQEPLEQAELQLSVAMKLLLNAEMNECYRKKSLERRKMLDIDSAVKKWVDISLE